MDPARLGLKPLFTALAAVFLLETGGAWIPGPALVVTGLVRLLDILLLSGLLLFMNKDLSAVGMSVKQLKPGLKTGVAWSAAFGAVVLAAGAVLMMAGHSPLDLFKLRLPATQAEFVLFFMVGGLIGPIAEELVYRGLIYTALRRWGLLVAISGSTLLFVLSHSLGSDLPLPQIIGGIVFALAYERSKSLFAPIVIHCLGNTAMFSLGLISSLNQFFY